MIQETEDSGFRSRLGEAGHVAPFFPLAALAQESDALEAFKHIAGLLFGTADSLETRMLRHGNTLFAVKGKGRANR